MEATCCGNLPMEEERIKEEKAAMEEEFTLNGVKLKVKDLFPDFWAAKDFVAKLRLLAKSKGLASVSPESIMDED